MKRIFTVSLLALAALVMAGCTVVNEVNAARYNENTKAGITWLSDQFDPANIDISGRWKSADWGKGVLTQKGRDVHGKLGDYEVQGVVSGNRAYLLLSEGGWNYYAAVIEKPLPGVMMGHFSRSIPFSKTFGRPMRLEKLPGE